MSAITTTKLTKRFDGVHAADKLSISIPEAKISGLIGPNGSGKTTLVNILTGLVPYDSGTIRIVSEKEHSLIQPYHVSGLGVTRTFQNVRLFEQMTVLDNILVVLTSRSVLDSIVERGSKEILDKAKSALKQVGLWEKHTALAHDLSYGQRKLLEIARALATNSEIYLFDEPFAGLFPEMVKLVKSIVLGLRERGKTVLLIEHDMQIIRDVCDHVIVMDAGTLLVEGEPEGVLTRRDVIEAYLGE